jgi:hypothetical protein
MLVLWVIPSAAHDTPLNIHTSGLSTPANPYEGGGASRKLLGTCCDYGVCRTYTCKSGSYLRCSPPTCIANSATIIKQTTGIKVPKWPGHK